MIDYQYFHFNPLLEDVVYEAFPDREREFMREAYEIWIEHFIRRARSFYGSQYTRHWNMVWSKFCRENDWRTDEPISYSEEDQLIYGWDHYADRVSLNKHEEANNWAFIHLNSYETVYLSDMPDWSTSTEMVQKYMDVVNAVSEGKSHPRLMRIFLDEQWFNTEIKADDGQAQWLRRLPYKQYLESSHWKRIRAAMILINGSRCQGDQCIGADSYWADESWLHVHHMTYKNRGKERFNDLRLVCDRCHKLIHQHGINFVFRHPELNYR